jgi:hypothetical protein
MPDLADDKIAKLLAERGVDTKRILALINGWFGAEAGPVQEDSAGGRMDKNCVDNAHKADWIREMNAMEHECDEQRKDNSFEVTGWPYAQTDEKRLQALRDLQKESQRLGLYDLPPHKEVINKPPHYTQGGIECIDAIEAALTEEEFRGYCKGQAIAYLWRERHKGGDVDVGKAGWYCNRLNGGKR